MYILGINAFHGDSSAALIKDGVLLSAIEEERIKRVKHWAGFPMESIKFCLGKEGISIEDIDYIAIGRDPMARIHKKLWRVITRVPSFSFLQSRFSNLKKIKNIKYLFAQSFGVSEEKIKAQIINVEHHRSHLASAFLVSPFNTSAVLSIDGFGDFASVAMGVGDSNKIKISKEVLFPHSLGIFYTALTQFIGFPNYGDEYKVMGLSAFGQPIYVEQLRRVVKIKENGLFELNTDYFLHDKEGVEMTWLNEGPKIGKLYSVKMEELLGPARKDGEELSERFKNLATSVQFIYEEVFFHILNNLYKETGIDNLCLAGGCAQNSLANGKITDKTSFKNIYIPPAGHDAGTAIGAGFYLWNSILGNKRSFSMTSSYLGQDFTDSYIENKLKENNLQYRVLGDEELIKIVVKILSEGNIVGFFQGRTEFGPRALGNRSILANPADKNIQDIINAKIKRREMFRPFAPSIMEEFVGEYFEKTEPVPFMERVYMFKKDKTQNIPAVIHRDGTGRLQTVSKFTNERYWNLINEFYKKTGVPMLLNTSFNENEPIVNRPEEAIACFLRTKMDALVLGNYLILRNDK